MSVSLATRADPVHLESLNHSTYRLSSLVLDNVADLEPYLMMLDELMDDSVEPNLYYESWVTRPAISSFIADNNVVFMVILATNPISERRSLCGFIPLALHETYRGLPVRNVTLWHYPHCFLATPIIRRGYSERCMAELLHWFKEGQSASLMVLNLLPAEGAIDTALSNAITHSDLRYSESRYTRATIESDSNAESRISKKIRSENRRRRKNLEKIGDVRWRSYRDTDNLETWVDEFFVLEGAGWKGDSETALCSNRANRAFFREIMQASSQRGRLKIVSLRLDDKPIAMIVVFLGYGGGHLFKMAFDEEYRRYAPGVMLNVELTRLLDGWDGVAWIDTCAAYDNDFANRLWPDRKPIFNIIVAKPFTIGAVIARVMPVLAIMRKRGIKIRKRLAIIMKQYLRRR